MKSKADIEREIKELREQREIITKRLYKLTRLLKHHAYLFEEGSP